MRRLVSACLLFGACASGPSKKAGPPAPPPPPVQVLHVRVGQPTRHFLSFVAGRTQAVGVALRYALLDRYGKVVLRRETRVGPSFNNGAVTAGRLTRWPLVLTSAGMLRVVGGPRPGAQDSVSQLALTERLQLLDARRCAIHRYRWRLGLPIPPDLTYTPNNGDEVEEIRCAQELLDRRLRESFRFEREDDREHGWLRFELTFNRDFEQGVVLELAVADASGKAHPSCLLRVAQPTVWEGQTKRYALQVTGVALVSVVRAIQALPVRRIDARPTLDRFIDVSLRCQGIAGEQSGRQAETLPPPSYRRGATILR